MPYPVFPSHTRSSSSTSTLLEDDPSYVSISWEKKLHLHYPKKHLQLHTQYSNQVLASKTEEWWMEHYTSTANAFINDMVTCEKVKNVLRSLLQTGPETLSSADLIAINEYIRKLVTDNKKEELLQLTNILRHYLMPSQAYILYMFVIAMPYKLSALHWAIIYKQRLPPSLLDSITQNEDRVSALHLAVNFNDYDAVCTMLNHDGGKAVKGLLTPLLLSAVNCENPKILSKLLESGADGEMPLILGMTALHLAARRGALEITKELLARLTLFGVNARDHFGQTPLFLAAAGGHADVVERLLECEDIYSELANITGNTPLFMAATHGYTDIVEQLLKKSSPDIVSMATIHGNTPLLMAAANGYRDIVELLLKSDCPDIVNMATVNGNTPLGAATTGEHADIVKILLSNGADGALQILEQHVSAHKTTLVDTFFEAGLYVPNPALDASPEKLKHVLLLRARLNRIDTLSPKRMMPLGYRHDGTWYLDEAANGCQKALSNLHNQIKNNDALKVWISTASAEIPYLCFRLFLKYVSFQLLIQQAFDSALKFDEELERDLYLENKHALAFIQRKYGSRRLTAWAKALAEAPAALAFGERFTRLYEAVRYQATIPPSRFFKPCQLMRPLPENLALSAEPGSSNDVKPRAGGTDSQASGMERPPCSSLP